MKRLSLSLFVFALALPGLASAQQPNAGNENFDEVAPAPTAEMWFYLQEMRRYDDPKNVVRRNAALRAAQRRDRIAAMKWYGLSNSRPRASATPYMGVYSPRWGGNRWVAPYWGNYGVNRAGAGPQIFVLGPRSRKPSMATTAESTPAGNADQVVANLPQPTQIK